MSITTLTAATNASRNQGRRPWPKRKLSTRQMMIASPVIGAAPRKGFGGSANAERDGAVRDDRPVARFARRHIASDNRGHGRGGQLAGAATSGFENIN